MQKRINRNASYIGLPDYERGIYGVFSEKSYCRHKDGCKLYKDRKYMELSWRELFQSYIPVVTFLKYNCITSGKYIYMYFLLDKSIMAYSLFMNQMDLLSHFQNTGVPVI